MSATTLQRTTGADTAPRRGRRMGAAGVAVAVALLVGFGASLLAPSPQRVVPTFAAEADVVVSGWGSEERFGVPGSYILRYEHDTDVELRLPWDGGAVVGARFGDERVRLLTVTGAVVDGDELVLNVRRHNCRYFHERAIDMFPGVDVTRASGRTTTLVFARPVFVKSPMLASCPDRTLDRQDDTRSGHDR